MKRLNLLIIRVLFNKVDSIGLSIFRIAYSIVFLFELIHLFKYRTIVYDGFTELNPTLIFMFWIPTVFLLLIGYKTRYVAILNYIFSVIILSSAQKYEYHGFTIYTGVNFLLIFLPIAKQISIDAFLKTKINTDDKKVFKVYYFAPVFLVIALIYLDSAFYKFASSMWLSGLGMWLPASLPMATWSSFPWLLNNELLVKFLGYLVLIFETVFILLMWFRVFRVPLLVIGVLFHLGILYFFPIPWFALAVICVYCLMVPIRFWKKIKIEKINRKISNFKISDKYKSEHFSNFRFSEKMIKTSWVLFFLGSFSIQALLTWRTPFMTELFSESIKKENSLPHKLVGLADRVDYVSHKFIGMTNHGLFLDDHFRGYSNIIKVEAKCNGKRFLIPLIKDNGQPSDYITGNLWTNYTFRVSSQHFNLDTYLMNVYPYLVYFCNTNNLKIKNVQFELFSKNVEVPSEWERDYLQKMMKKNWDKIGVYSIVENKLVKTTE